MTQTTGSDLSLGKPLDFDIVSARFKADPAPTFAAMRAAGPVIPVKLPFVGRVWVTTTHAAALAMVKDNALFVQEGRNAGKSGVAGFSWWLPKSIKALTNNMLQKDEPDHRRLRKLVDTAFARRDVLAMRPDVEKVADQILDRFEGRADVDLVDDYARQLPLAVICDLLGLPDADRAEFSALAQQALGINSALGLILAAGAFGKMLDYGRRQIEAARRNPQPGPDRRAGARRGGRRQARRGRAAVDDRALAGRRLRDHPPPDRRRRDLPGAEPGTESLAAGRPGRAHRARRRGAGALRLAGAGHQAALRRPRHRVRRRRG